MAHPANAFPDAIFNVSTASEPLKPKGGFVYAITNVGSAATILQVKTNFFEYRTATEAITNHIDPTTGALGVAGQGLAAETTAYAPAGYYEVDNNDFVDLDIQSGQTVYGKFTEVQIKSGSTGSLVAYCTTKRQIGLEL